MGTSPAVDGTLAITTFHNNFHQCNFFLFVSSGGTYLVFSIVLVYRVACDVFLHV